MQYKSPAYDGVQVEQHLLDLLPAHGPLGSPSMSVDDLPDDDSIGGVILRHGCVETACNGPSMKINGICVNLHD